MASQKQLDKLLEEMLNPTSSLFEIVGKRGLDEVLGSDYDPYKKSINQIKRDILRLGKLSNKKSRTKKLRYGGEVKPKGMKHGGSVDGSRAAGAAQVSGKGIVARGCGSVLPNRRKRTTGSVSA